MINPANTQTPEYTLAAFPFYPDGSIGDQLAATRAPSVSAVFAEMGSLLEGIEVGPGVDALDLTLSWRPSEGAR